VKGKLLHAVETSDGRQVIYRLHILVGRDFYVVEQRPNFFLNAFLASEFTMNGPVLVRVTDKNIYLMRPNGRDMRMTIRAKRRMTDEEVAALNALETPAASSDEIADMLNKAAERGALIPRGIPYGN
jgi:hypothetical protein